MMPFIYIWFIPKKLKRSTKLWTTNQALDSISASSAPHQLLINHYKKKKKKGSIAVFLKCGYRSEKRVEATFSNMA